LPGVLGDFCPQCDEYVLGAEESRRVMDLMLAFNKQVNAAAVDPQFILDVRKKLNLDQRQAGEIFGGGVNAFSDMKTEKPNRLSRPLSF
jgi:HTH-type transcriptional regulator/antitoxin MqsA